MLSGFAFLSYLLKIIRTAKHVNFWLALFIYKIIVFLSCRSPRLQSELGKVESEKGH